MPKDQRDFYEAWRVGEEDAGMSPQKALLLAAEANADPNNRLKRLSASPSRDQGQSEQPRGRPRLLFGGPSSPDNIGEMGPPSSASRRTMRCSAWGLTRPWSVPLRG